MPSTTHPEFNNHTEALEVAQAFPSAIQGKTAIVTGVNPNGIGFATAEALASQSPTHLILTGRTPSKLTTSISLLRAKYPSVTYHALPMDLSDQSSVRTAANTILTNPSIPEINIVINSAGIMNIPTRTLTPDGIEITFATNHIGHFLFTCLLMPKIIAAAKTNPRGTTRIVNVSSLSPTIAKMRWSDHTFSIKNKDLPEAEQPNYNVLRQWGATDVENASYVPVEAYNQSKVANVLFGIGLTRKLWEKFGILGAALHPGIIQTELARGFGDKELEAVEKMKQAGYIQHRSLGAGAATSLVAALDPGLAEGMVGGEVRDGKENWGAFLLDCQISGLAAHLAVASEEADRLWGVSEGLVGEKFEW
ncbi:putative short-chain dehydrogenase [Aspergillus ellipticus CBS 707.79]|uniref:Putative short-chain dehydrogenase n=1 Tax=Aspergillus ellipticus CBS 707.79 TaxID=1448320 RepID=A0A319D287_9EURO|nr:putative short-chain dehydrogenase [Aspergillus ellipticus CBS 707.79]